MKTSERTRIPRTVPAVLAALILIALIAAAAAGNAAAQAGPPAAPLHPTASLVLPDGGYARVRVGWDNPQAPEITGYTVSRSDGRSFDSSGQATTYTDKSALPGSSYAYTVTARSAGGDSPASAAAGISLPDPPAEAQNVSAAVRTPEAAHESVHVTLTWDPAPEPGPEACEESYPVTEYRLSRSSGNEAPVEMAVVPEGATLSHTDETGDFNTAYVYHVEAVSRIGRGTASTSAVSTPKRPVPSPTDLDVDEAATSDPFDGTVTLDWTAPQEGPAITGYRITRQDPGAQARVLVEDIGSTDTAYTDSGLSAGETYIYTAAALSTDNASPESGPLSVWAPLPVLDPAARADTDHIAVSWTAPEETRYHGYIVRRREADGTQWTMVHVMDSLHYADGADPLNPFAGPPAHDTPYVYSVQSRNELGIGSVWAQTGTVILMTKPGAPAGVTAEAVNGDIRVGWTRPAGRYLDGYRVSRRLQARGATAPGEWTTIQDGLAADAVSHMDTDVEPTVQHSYRVQVYNAAGGGPWSEEASGTHTPAPTVPESVTAEISGTGVVVSWTVTEDSYNDGYDVRHRIAGGEWEVTGSLKADQGNSHTHENAAPGVTHEYQVRSRNGAGESAWSETASAIRVDPPGMPADLAAAVRGTDIAVTWTAPASGLVSGYDLEHRIQGAAGWTRESVDGTSHTHTGPQADVYHEYRVRTRNAAGESGWTDSVTARVLNLPPPPAQVSASVQGNDIRVSWTAPGTGIVDSYGVSYGVTGETDTQTASVDAPATEFIHSNPPGDTPYQYRVRSVNASGSSEWSATATATRVIPPPPPTGLTAAAEQTDIILSWTAPETGIVDHYQLDHRRQGETAWSANTVPAGTVSYAHTGAPSATVHEYRVRAVNAGGHSGWTDTATGIWYEGVQPPVRISVFQAGEFLLAQWPASATPGVTGYQFRSRIDGGQWDQATPRRLNHFLRWNRQQSLHEYQVRALIEDTSGQWSAVRRVVIDTPGAVSNVRANRESDIRTRVHWDPPEGGAPYRFVIEAKRDDLAGWHTAGGTNGLKTTHLVNGQAPGHRYQYRVRAQNDVGIRGPAGRANAPVDIPAEPHQWPHVPGKLRLTMINSSTVQLHWRAPTERGDQVTNYRVYRKPVSDSQRLGDSYGHVLTPQTGNTRTVYTDLTARPGVLYEYGVAAYRDGYPNPMSHISHPAYARTW